MISYTFSLFIIFTHRYSCPQFLSLFFRIRSCSRYTSVLRHCWLATKDLDLTRETSKKSIWPIHHTQDSIDFEELKLDKENTVKANTSVLVNVRMEHFRLEHHIRRLVRVLLCEFEFKFEQSSLPWSSLDALNDGLPLKQIIFKWSGADAFIFLFFNFLKILEKSALGCCRHLYFVFINFYKSQAL